MELAGFPEVLQLIDASLNFLVPHVQGLKVSPDALGLLPRAGLLECILHMFRSLVFLWMGLALSFPSQRVHRIRGDVRSEIELDHRRQRGDGFGNVFFANPRLAKGSAQSVELFEKQMIQIGTCQSLTS